MSEPTHAEHFVPDLAGIGYIDVLANYHRVMQPRTYLEVGIWSGDSLKVAQCASIAVDPEMRVEGSFMGSKPFCHLFQMTSDRFFREFNPKQVLQGPIEMAFLDGLHYWEVLLRDIFNTEKHCSEGSVIVLHDCVPTDVYMTERVSNPDDRRMKTPNWQSWTGDVWKVIPALRKYRPDIRIHTVDAVPTGLVFLTCLNPNFSMAPGSYFEMLEEFGSIELVDYGLERFHHELNLQSTSGFMSLSDLSSRFML